MNKTRTELIIGTVCCILTVAISIQVKTVNSTTTTVTQSFVDNELRDNVLKWKEKYDNAILELTDKELKLEEIRDEATKDNIALSAMASEVSLNNKIVGKTDVEGSGIVIELEDGIRDSTNLSLENVSKKLIHFEDLLYLVNELNNSGAEAIEINGQRIIDTSSITCEGTVIKINGEKIGSPFTIKVIGSQALLYGQITRIGSYLELMQSDGVVVTSITKQDNIHISKYSGTLNYNYINILED